jgi:hypothetical protein
MRVVTFLALDTSVSDEKRETKKVVTVVMLLFDHSF